MKRYKIIIDSDALKDIQDATDWYNKQVKSLGSRFQKQVKLHINFLVDNPNGFAIRYKDVRCMVIKKFPFILHFTINEDENLVKIFALFHTSRNPEIWLERNNIK
jgi:mRNA-degrading endonuclease RelE of RelBE toxin-antitoxin system